MKKTILIVDDDRNICKFLSESLQQKGFLVEAFQAAEPALESLRQKSYALALVDLLLPGMSGIEFCRQLRAGAGQAELPVMLMTASPQDGERVKELQEELAISDCLFKPFTLDHLHQRVGQLLGVEAPAEDATRPVRIKGRLEETSIGQMLHDLYTLKSTGLLQVERGGLKKVVYFRDGYPIFARSNVVKECLGQMLVEDGLISAEQCAESLRQVKASGRLQGTVLIEMGLLTPHQLHDTLRQQVTEKLLEIFSWTDGEYQFIQGRNFKQGITSIDLSPAALIYQGIRRHFSADRLNRLLAPHRFRYPAPAENPHYRFQEIGFSRRDERIFAQCNGAHTLEEICARHPLARHETEQLLAALLVSEMVISLEKPPAGVLSDDDPLLSEENRRLREQLLEDYARMIRQDYFDLLGVGTGESREALRKAYFSLAKRYHPDRFLRQGLPDELKSKLNELFQRIGEAYETLSNPTRSRDYLEQLQHREDSRKPKIEEILQAETAYQKGRHLLHSRMFREALEYLSVSRELCPEEPEYLTHYAWALSRTQPRNPEIQQQAKQMLLQSNHLNGQLFQTHLYLGQLLKEEGKLREAEKRFELALQCNPNCTEALRELRLSNMRRDKEQKAKGLLGRVFRK